MEGNLLHAVVVLPLQIRVLERLAVREDELHGHIGHGVGEVVGVLSHQNRELSPFDELLDEDGSVLLHKRPALYRRAKVVSTRELFQRSMLL